MALSSNINAYADIAAVLEPIVIAGGQARYELKTRGMAIRWRQRAYKYRLLYQNRLAEGNPLGFTPRTPYDAMKLTIENNCVVIDMQPEPGGKILLPGGKTIYPLVGNAGNETALERRPRILPRVSKSEAAEMDELSAAAAALIAEVGLQDDD